MLRTNPERYFLEYLDVIEWAVRTGGMTPGIELIRRIRARSGREAGDAAKRELERLLDWARQPRNQKAWSRLVRRLESRVASG